MVENMKNDIRDMEMVLQYQFSTYPCYFKNYMENKSLDKFMELKKNCFGGIHTLPVDGKKTTILRCGCKLVETEPEYIVEFCKIHKDL